MAADPQAQGRPPPPQPRIPSYLLDGPQQRLFVTSLLALLTAYKLADALLPRPDALPSLADELPVNWLLWKWVAVDLAFVTAVAWLRVPRLDWGWKARWVLRAVLVALDYALFGRWTVRATALPLLLLALTLGGLAVHRIRLHARRRQNVLDAIPVDRRAFGSASSCRRERQGAPRRTVHRAHPRRLVSRVCVACDNQI